MNLVRKGFTLIELIVVIVIIGILAAVAAVAYNAFIGNANTSAATAEATDLAKLEQANAALGNRVADYEDANATSGDVTCQAYPVEFGATWDEATDGFVTTAIADGFLLSCD